MRIDILSIFPGYFDIPINEGILKIARDKGLLIIKTIDIRDFTEDKHRQVDDYPYGGGPGMVMKPDPVFKAVESVLDERPESWREQARTVLLTPRGKQFDQSMAAEFAGEERIVLICGHYEGIDERVHQKVSDEVSIGDYVLSGGEPAALVFVDAITRLLKGVLGSAESLAEESFIEGLLEYPQYTRPALYEGMKVPDVLLSGDHAKIASWKRMESIRQTYKIRPDILKKASLSQAEKDFIKALNEQKDKGEGKDEQDRVV